MQYHIIYYNICLHQHGTQLYCIMGELEWLKVLILYDNIEAIEHFIWDNLNAVSQGLLRSRFWFGNITVHLKTDLVPTHTLLLLCLAELLLDFTLLAKQILAS